MKRFLVLTLTLTAAALAGRASAQTVVTNAQAAGEAPVIVTGAQPAGGAPVVITPAPAAPAGCAPGCTQKVCVQVPDVIKHSKVVYGCREKEFCVKGICGSCDGSSGDCACCVRCKRVLLKKTVTCEEPGFKCEVAEQPACAGESCGPRCAGGACPAGGCVLPTCRFGQRSNHSPVVVPDAPAPVNPGQKMPPAPGGSGGAGAPAFPIAPIAPAASGAAPAQPLPAGEPR